MDSATTNKNISVSIRKVIPCSIVTKPDGSYVYDDANTGVLVRQSDGNTLFVPYSLSEQSSQTTEAAHKKVLQEEPSESESESQRHWQESEIIELVKEELEIDSDSSNSHSQRETPREGKNVYKTRTNLHRRSVSWIEDLIRKREEARERRNKQKQKRHEEKLARQDAVIEMLRSLTSSLDKLVNKSLKG